MSQSPLLSIALFLGALYLLKLWWEDMRLSQNGTPNPKAFPGACMAPPSLLLLAAGGAILLVGIETVGEYALGISSEQTDVTALFLLPMLGAGILEEILFRGYLVITRKGRAALITSCALFSALFALLHYQYYISIPDGEGWTSAKLQLNAKAIWSLSLLFLNSLWFYAVRFARWNANQSMLPCFVAHISSNLAVFFVKAAQGHLSGWY